MPPDKKLQVKIFRSFTLYYFFGSNLTIYTKVSYICTGILKDKLACSLAPDIVRKTSLATALYSVLASSIWRIGLTSINVLGDNYLIFWFFDFIWDLWDVFWWNIFLQYCNLSWTTMSMQSLPLNYKTLVIFYKWQSQQLIQQPIQQPIQEQSQKEVIINLYYIIRQKWSHN